MSRNTSILSVVVAMAVLSVLFVVSVAFAEQGGSGLGHPKVTLCHKGHTITVGAPAEAAHLNNHGDTRGACADTAAPSTTGTTGTTTGTSTTGTTDTTGTTTGTTGTTDTTGTTGITGTCITETTGSNGTTTGTSTT